MDRNLLYLRFAIDILESIAKDDLTNPGALDRLKIYYAKVEENELQDIVLNYCDHYNIKYSITTENKMHTVTFKSNDWAGMANIVVTSDDLTDAMVEGSLKVYDRIALLSDTNKS
jgi:hypothetical protein